MYNEKWFRVSEKHRCFKCGKPDWCTYTQTVVCCMRVVSDKPMTNGGWMHKLDKPIVYIPTPKKSEETTRSQVDFKALWSGWFKKMKTEWFVKFGEQLSVDPVSLHLLGCCWSSENRAWAFPMKNHEGEIIGIRMRGKDGRKWAVTGSKQGLFLSRHAISGIVFIVEGASDAAAAITLGMPVIGRASCLGQEQLINKTLYANKINRVVIISDSDTPGLNGAKKLQERLKVRSCLWTPPAKDFREYIKAGATREIIESQLKDLIWSN